MYITVHQAQGLLVLNNEDELAEFSRGKLIIEAAGGMVYNEKGELLMMFRRGQWDLPKGKIDDGESMEQCAIREVEEETGLSKLKLVMALQTTYHTYSLHGNTVLKPSHWFKMESKANETLVPQTEEDISDLRWVDKIEAVKLIENAYPSIREMVAKYFLS